MGKVVGGDLRLFEHLEVTGIRLEKIKLFESGARTDLWFRIVH